MKKLLILVLVICLGCAAVVGCQNKAELLTEEQVGEVLTLIGDGTFQGSVKSADTVGTQVFVKIEVLDLGDTQEGKTQVNDILSLPLATDVQLTSADGKTGSDVKVFVESLKSGDVCEVKVVGNMIASIAVVE